MGWWLGGGIIESLLLHTRYLRHWTQGVWDIFHASPDRVRQDLKYLSEVFCITCACGRIKFEEVLLCLHIYDTYSRSQWPRGVRRGFTAARLLELRARIPPEARMSLSCDCRLLSVRGLSRRDNHSSRGVLPNVICRNECEQRTS